MSTRRKLEIEIPNEWTGVEIEGLTDLLDIEYLGKTPTYRVFTGCDLETFNPQERAYTNGYRAGRLEGIRLAREELFKELEINEIEDEQPCPNLALVLILALIKRLYKLRESLI